MHARCGSGHCASAHKEICAARPHPKPAETNQPRGLLRGKTGAPAVGALSLLPAGLNHSLLWSHTSSNVIRAFVATFSPPPASRALRSERPAPVLTSPQFGIRHGAYSDDCRRQRRGDSGMSRYLLSDVPHDVSGNRAIQACKSASMSVPLYLPLCSPSTPSFVL